MKKEMRDEFSEKKVKNSKHKAKLKPYKRSKYKDYETEDVQFRCFRYYQKWQT